MPCDICLELQKDKRAYFFSSYGSSLPDRIVLETANFCVIPSIGQITEGHLLIVPKEHYLSTGHLPERFIGEVKGIKDRLYAALARSYKAPIFFEHGCSEENGGCGVYHAHIHAVPCGETEKFWERLSREHTLSKLSDISGLAAYSKAGNAYIYLEDCHRNEYSSKASGIPSQYLRKLLAESMLNGNWDWRSYKNDGDKLEKTYHALKERLNLSAS